MIDGRFLAFFTVPSGVTIIVTANGITTVVAITAGVYTIATFMTQLQTNLQAQRPPAGSAWTVSLSTGASGTGQVTIDAPDDTWSITWTSTDLRDLLGFEDNIAGVTTAQTGVAHARGLWMPDCTLFLAHRYKAAPPSTDLRQTESPDGFVIGHVGNRKYKHRNVRYQLVPFNRVWLADEVVENESLEAFLTDVQWGLGHAWFTNTSKCVIVLHDGTEIGGGSVAGWYIKGCESMDACTQRADESWDGNWTVTFPELVTNS